MAVEEAPVTDGKKGFRGFLIAGFLLFLLFIGVAGVMGMAMDFLSDLKKPKPAPFDAPESRGFAGLENWNIEGKDLRYNELLIKYQELYNYTYPFVLREAIKDEIVPYGVPVMYGEELDVAYDADTDQMTNILRRYEDHPLNEEQMERYKDIGLRISCEYCCGVKAIIFENGERACGCAHSYAMRGLAKYLLINHPDHYTNDEILLELGKWKATFFPKQTISKAAAKYIELGSIDPSILIEMPDMVGSC